MSLHNSLFLPKDKLPECWDDEERVNVLFAPFRNRSVNPQDWDSKMAFWKNLIATYCTVNKVYTFKTTDLLKVFNKNGRSPGCLAIIVEEMLKNGEIQVMDKFLQRPPDTWGGWATNIFIKKPVLWSYSKIKDTLISPNAEFTYVHLEATQIGAEDLVSSIPDKYRNKVINLKELLEITGLDTTKAEYVKLLLHHLVCQGKADLKELREQNNQDTLLHNVLVKFGDVKKVTLISEIDISIHILEQNEKTLVKNIETLENEVNAAVSDAKSYLAKGSRQTVSNRLENVFY